MVEGSFMKGRLHTQLLFGRLDNATNDANT